MHNLSESLPPPTVGVLFSQWSLQPFALLVIAVAAVWWVRSVRILRRRGTPWPLHRSIVFALGLFLFGWVTNGFAQAYSTSVFSVWVSQSLLLLLVVPAALVAAQPVELARLTVGDRAVLVRFVRSRVGRFLSSPFVGPAIVPVICTVIFFGSVPGWAVRYEWVNWSLALVLAVAGAMIVLPLLSSEGGSQGSLVVGIALGVGLFELMVDAVPGIVMRLQTSISSTFFDYRPIHLWTVPALTDQQGSGAILWGAAELLDLPFLLLIFHRWLIADARDAAEIDTVLDAERISRGALARVEDAVDDAPVTPVTIGEADQPWWLQDPVMRERLRRQN
ncbi:Cytochrome c oxidase assembly factor CtaG [Frankineae bacterium MT45]|nr:Cytochrome c oxidase assembly factor CtaG [Frankineae bacterium MT45]